MILILILDVVVIHAQWSTDPWKSTIISNTGINQSNQILANLVGGSILVAWSKDNSNGYDIYAQGVDRNGVALWKINGVEVCVLKSNNVPSAVIPDTIEGAFIFWSDTRTGVSDIYMQRLDKYGLPHFVKNGIPVFDSAAHRDYLRAIPDGAGGTMIVWQEYTRTLRTIRAQHLNADGRVLWAQSSVIAVRDVLSQAAVTGMVDDGSGGLIVCWREAVPNRYHKFYAQRIDSIGRIRWDSSSVTVSNLDVGIVEGTNEFQLVEMAKDETYGAYFAFQEVRKGRRRIYLQHVDSSGTITLGNYGRLISDTNLLCTLTDVVANGRGQVFLSWWFQPNAVDSKIQSVLQLFGKDGSGLWPEPVILPPVSTATSYVRYVSDDSGGVIAFWLQVQDGQAKVYSQRFNSDGSRRWEEEGRFFAAIQQNPLYFFFLPQIISDGSHGAVMAYVDVPGSQKKELRIQHINEDGVLGVPKNSPPPPVDSDSTESPIVGIRSISPNPSTGILDLEFVVPVRGTVTVTVYNAIGEVVAVPFQEFVQRDIATTISIDLSAQSSGAFFCRLTGPYINESKMFIVQH
ncbi:MAG: T9SS type A sorting domain-containing protein [Ignavibacteria bacterium]|nr:T9SS type A sorting domain-containing protein [Ignavibacteria bacterium]MBP6509871.1 T9SS type A sorting domain-containing protein [Candidatus Kapabacteria bacterium]MBK6420141.1 T9SS type A sorting domain-containing protein [Ignavibacteria bacterium]MBK6759223.1 T9SS type A sorting domain-containing protein [Ignavibacteria bacterium]MBK7034338.1 T9SS type A sorting domain-containing protein [Ignavibacteria bacterium]